MCRRYPTALDFFCGAGGRSIALDAAGVTVEAAMNHNAVSIASHQANFPTVQHDCMDITTIDPRRYPATAIGVFTPECTFHTPARGERVTGQGQVLLWDDVPADPNAVRSRVTMNEVVRFTAHHRYWIVVVENVVEIMLWSGLHRWLADMHALGYDDQPIFFNSQFAPAYPYPAPQSRDRVYWVFWRTGKRPDLTIRPPAWCDECAQEVAAVQSWKNQKRRWGTYGRSYVYRCPHCASAIRPRFHPASSAINWSLPAPRIGDRDKPLKETTLRRIRVGLSRFSGETFALDLADTHGHDRRVHVLSEPSGALTSQATRALCVPAPFRVTIQSTSTAASLREPCATVVAGGMHHALVVPPDTNAFLTSYYRTGTASSLADPVPTLTGRDRHSLVVLPDADPPDLDDCGFRMLDPDTELKRIMGFPPQYILTGNKRQRVQQLGQSLTPAAVTQIVQRCVATLAYGTPMNNEHIARYRVPAASVEDVLDRSYKPERFRGRDEQYAAGLIQSYSDEVETQGYTWISRHDSVTGQVVAYFPPESEEGYVKASR